jgi:hypothetical protein
MTVAELITNLQTIDDKSLEVKIRVPDSESEEWIVTIGGSHADGNTIILDFDYSIDATEA